MFTTFRVLYLFVRSSLSEGKICRKCAHCFVHIKKSSCFPLVCFDLLATPVLMFSCLGPRELLEFQAMLNVHLYFLAGVQVFLVTLIHAEALMPLTPSLCRSHDLPDFRIDTARLTIDNDGRSAISLVLYTQSKECHEVSDFFLCYKASDHFFYWIDSIWEAMS